MDLEKIDKNNTNTANGTHALIPSSTTSEFVPSSGTFK